MSKFLKSVVLGLGLVGGITIGAHAQTTGTSIANLPADAGPRLSSHNNIPGPARQAVAPSANKSDGVAPGGGWYPAEKQTQAVQPSTPYPGVRPN